MKDCESTRRPMKKNQPETPELMRSTLPNTDQPRIPTRSTTTIFVRKQIWMLPRASGVVQVVSSDFDTAVCFIAYFFGLLLQLVLYCFFTVNSFGHSFYCIRNLSPSCSDYQLTPEVIQWAPFPTPQYRQ